MSKPLLRLLQLEGVPIFRQLQIEEALLRSESGNWCLINRGSAPAIVMGISGKPSQWVSEQAGRQNLPLIKRFSGGGTVVVDENTDFVTFIGSDALVGGPCFPESIHRFAEEIYACVFSFSDFALRENDYVFGEKKFGGNAQYFRKGRWLHHTTFLWDWSQQRMEALLLPPRMPGYRSGRPHHEFLCRLNERFNDRSEVSYRLVETLKGRFDIEEAAIADVEEWLALPHRKATQMVAFESFGH